MDQRRINFAVRSSKADEQMILEDPIDDPETPKKARTTPTAASTKRTKDPIDDSLTPQKPKPFCSCLLGSGDPIDDIDSPKKTKSTPVYPAAMIARANAADRSAKKFLNLTGTQFIMPTQVDPAFWRSRRKTSDPNSCSINSLTSREQSPALESHIQPKRHLPKPLPSQFHPELRPTRRYE